MSTGRRVVVTGLGCICAAGPDLASTTATVFAGRREPAAPSHFSTDHEVAYPVFEIPDRWIGDDAGLPDHQRCGALARIAAREAVADAGLEDLDRLASVAVSLGSVVGAALDNEGFQREVLAGAMPSVEPVKSFLRANPAALLARDLGVIGPYQTVTTACTSGTLAIAQAADWIKNGLCEVALAGGAEKLGRISYDGFASLRLADPEPCRPFDRHRAGLNLGEGAALLVLESEDHARRRGARRRAVLVGVGNAADAWHMAQPHPEGRGLRRAIDQALSMAGRGRGEVAFINAHGTGTVENDRVEGRVFADWFASTPFHSTKEFTGHTLGAAGAIEAALTVVCLERGRIPASVGFAEPDPEIGTGPVREETVVSGRCALSTSVGYGGSNGALLFVVGDDD